MDSIRKALSRVPERTAETLGRHLIPASAPLREALGAINSLGGGSMTLFAVDDDGRPCGSVTDGDIRRAILARDSVDISVKDVMHCDFKALRPGGDRYKEAKALKKAAFDLVPLIDEDGYIVSLWDTARKDSFLPLDAVLMAGGRGERLRPLTLETPKPLLPVGDKAIIDYNIERLARAGVDNIFVTVNYLKEKMIEHFAEPVADVEVKCVSEEKRTGTFGSLTLVDGLVHDNVLVMNSDLLTTISFQKMYEHHINSGAVLTMAVVPYTVSVPFALLSTEGDRVTALEEKPVYNHFANAGVYILKRELIDRIAPGTYVDAPDFIRDLIGEGKKVSYFPIDGLWVDIGSPADYRHACELVALLK